MWDELRFFKGMRVTITQDPSKRRAIAVSAVISYIDFREAL